MTRQMSFIHSAPASTTTATTTPWPLLALPGALELHALPRFRVEALYRYPWHSMAKGGTCLKIMVSLVRVRVPPLLFLAIRRGNTKQSAHHPALASGGRGED
jgi:hypothetical protein